MDDRRSGEFRLVGTLVLYLDCTNLLVSMCEARLVSLFTDINMLEQYSSISNYSFLYIEIS